MILFFILNSITLISATLLTEHTYVLLGSNRNFKINSNTCIEIQIPNNYKKIELVINSYNISKIIITDQQFIPKENNSLIETCINNNATFCMEDIYPTQSIFNLQYCVDKSFIYICNNNNNIGNINITTNVIKGEGCQLNIFSDETECANLGLDLCRSNQKCLKNCQYVECLNYDDTHLFSMCIPSQISLNEVSQKCDNHLLFNKDGKNGKVLTKKCELNEDINNISKNFLHTVIYFFIVFIGLFNLTTFMASVYYRFKTSIDSNRPPFNPPWFCPNFVFPRVNPNTVSLV